MKKSPNRPTKKRIDHRLVTVSVDWCNIGVLLNTEMRIETHVIARCGFAIVNLHCKNQTLSNTGSESHTCVCHQKI